MIFHVSRQSFYGADFQKTISKLCISSLPQNQRCDGCRRMSGGRGGSWEYSPLNIYVFSETQYINNYKRLKPSGECKSGCLIKLFYFKSVPKDYSIRVSSLILANDLLKRTRMKTLTSYCMCITATCDAAFLKDQVLTVSWY